MSDETHSPNLQRAVLIRYPQPVDPSPAHPSGYAAGSMFIISSPAVADEHHPDAYILGYADGGIYNQRSARAYATRQANATNETPPEPDEDATGSPLTGDTGAGGSTDVEPPSVDPVPNQTAPRGRGN